MSLSLSAVSLNSTHPHAFSHILPSFTVSILTCWLGNFCISIALNLQKLAHLKLQPAQSSSATGQSSPSPPDHQHFQPNEETPLLSPSSTGSPTPKVSSEECRSNPVKPSSNLAYLTSPIWWSGIILMTAGELCNFVSCEFDIFPKQPCSPTILMIPIISSRWLCTRQCRCSSGYCCFDQQLRSSSTFTGRTLSQA